MDKTNSNNLFQYVTWGVAIFGTLFGGYQYYTDTSCFERLSKAREYIDKGNAIIYERDNNEYIRKDLLITQSHVYYRRGIEMLNNIKNQNSCPICPTNSRREAINELINFYNLYPNENRYKDTITILKNELQNFKN